MTIITCDNADAFELTVPRVTGDSARILGRLRRFVARLGEGALERERHRTDIELLRSFDDHLLRDIGITRGQIVAAVHGER